MVFSRSRLALVRARPTRLRAGVGCAGLLAIRGGYARLRSRCAFPIASQAVWSALLCLMGFSWARLNCLSPTALVRASSCLSAHLRRLAATLRARLAFTGAAFLIYFWVKKMPLTSTVRGTNQKSFVDNLTSKGEEPRETGLYLYPIVSTLPKSYRTVAHSARLIMYFYRACCAFSWQGLPLAPIHHRKGSVSARRVPACLWCTSREWFALSPSHPDVMLPLPFRLR